MTVGKYVSCIRQSEFPADKLLQEEFCSPWWLAASHVRRPDQDGRINICRKRGAYPAPGMIKCSACGRWAPADLNNQICVDCRIENDSQAFLRRAYAWPPEDRPEFARRYWRRPVLVHDWLLAGMPVPVGGIDKELPTPTDSDNKGSLIDEADLFDGQLEQDQTWGHGPSFREVLQQLRRRFTKEDTDKDGQKRLKTKYDALGCCKIMFSESERSLRKEIAFFRATGQIYFQARRVNDPYDKHEKHLPMPGQKEQLDDDE